MAKFLQLVNGVPRMVSESSSLTIYDQSVTIGAGGLATGAPLTLPNSQTYTDYELEVYFNGQRVEDSLDYNFVGVAPRTQITFTFDLVQGDIVRLRIDRAP